MVQLLGSMSSDIARGEVLGCGVEPLFVVNVMSYLVTFILMDERIWADLIL